MKAQFILILVLSFNLANYGQNAFDENGKKQGKWLLYLDHNWKEVNDSSKANYCRYTFYESGKNLYPMGACGKKGWTLESQSKTKLLDGEYLWKDAAGKVISRHIFKQGIYLNCYEYFENGKVNQHFAYSKKYKAEENTYCVYQYNEEGLATFFIMRNGLKGWGLYQGSEDDIEIKKK